MRKSHPSILLMLSAFFACEGSPSLSQSADFGLPDGFLDDAGALDADSLDLSMIADAGTFLDAHVFSDATIADVQFAQDAQAAPDVPMLGVDLIVDRIRRDSLYYYVQFCNHGAVASVATFTVEITHVTNGTSYETNSLYPFNVPAPGSCDETGGITCELIGDSQCSSSILVRAKVDPQNAVAETNEQNNEFSVQF